MDETEDDLALPEPQAAAPKKTSVLGLIAATAVITVVAAAGGGAVAIAQYEKISEVAQERANEPPDKADGALAWAEESAVIRLDPILTNLAQPSGVWIRLTCALVVEHGRIGDIEHMAASISQDILAFLRTVTLGELQGASAFAHLRDDLNERARIASDGAVQELIIETMVIQ